MFHLSVKYAEEDGLIEKTIYPELPPRSEYKITDLGESLLPIIDAMLKWGEEHFDVFFRKYGSNKTDKMEYGWFYKNAALLIKSA